ncbi:PIR protein [Plasmodium vivax]|uniref:VIR protein n=1 Tax=Plasmodium vivax TaxID=5855 RepID=A0A565A5R1_PLAVI|nr:PIR protein [Plasmodium vivax]
MALSPEENWVEVLQNLPSYKEYDKFDKVDIKNENSSHCKDLGSTDEGDKTFCKQIVQNLSQLSTLEDDENLENRSTDEGDKKLCKKIVQNLSQLSALKDDENLKNSCYYFQHWFFDNIAKKYYNGNERGNNYPVAGKLFNIVSTAISEHIKISSLVAAKPAATKPPVAGPVVAESERAKPEAGKVPGSGGDEREKKAQVDEVAAVTKGQEPKEKVVSGEVPKEKSADSLAQSAPEKSVLAKPAVQESVGAKPGGLESREEKAEPAKPVAAKPTTAMPAPPELAPAKPVAAKPAATKPPVAGPVVAESERAKPEAEKPVAVKAEGTVSEDESAKKQAAEEEQNEVETDEVETDEVETDEVETDEVVTTEELVAEMPSAMQHEEALGSQPVESVEQGVRAMSSYTTEPASNAIPLAIADSTNTLRTTHEELDSNFFRNVIMAIASSRLESSLRKKKRKKGEIFEHNYYEEYEKELAMYGSEETFLDSETDRLYLNYHPDQDSYY